MFRPPHEWKESRFWWGSWRELACDCSTAARSVPLNRPTQWKKVGAQKIHLLAPPDARRGLPAMRRGCALGVRLSALLVLLACGGGAGPLPGSLGVSGRRIEQQQQQPDDAGTGSSSTSTSDLADGEQLAPGGPLRLRDFAPELQQEPSVAAAAGLLLRRGTDADFTVPGEYIVTLASGCTSGGAYDGGGVAGDPHAFAQRLRRRHRAAATGHVYTGLLRGFVLRLPVAPAAPGAAAPTTQESSPAGGGEAQLRVLSALLADPCVQAVEPNARVWPSNLTARLAAGDSTEPGVQRILAASPTRVHGASRVAIAVLDSGIDTSHRDLNVVGGADCTVPDAAPCAPGNYTDRYGHGTHVAGIAAARNNGRGVVGVAPGSRLFAVKVLTDAGSGDVAMMIKGLEWVRAFNAKQRNDTEKIRVVNLSVNTVSRHPWDARLLPPSCANGSALHSAVCALISDTRNGAVLVGSAANEAASLDNFVPAAFPETLTVMAMAAKDGEGMAAEGPASFGCVAGGERYLDDAAAPFSNYVTKGSGAEWHAVAAPGVCIRSTWPGGGYRVMSGTSMAAPHVAGLVALCFGEGRTVGACVRRFSAPGGAANVIRTLVGMASYRQMGPGGFDGDAATCGQMPDGCVHYGYLVNATMF